MWGMPNLLPRIRSMPASLPQGPQDLAVRFADLLPPRRVGIHALSELASALRTFEQATPVAPGAAGHVLSLSYQAAAPFLVRMVRRSVERLSSADGEDVVQNLLPRLGAVYAAWRQEGTFAALLHQTLRWDALKVLERASRSRPLPADPRGDDVDGEEENGVPQASPELQALRRFVWYLYASPDNPRRFTYAHATADFEAFAGRLDGLTYLDLMRLNQPAPGDWGQGQGGDTHWWRNRLKEGRRHVDEKLARPTYRAFFNRILQQLGGEV